jgi:hypothetical protein
MNKNMAKWISFSAFIAAVVSFFLPFVKVPLIGSYTGYNSVSELLMFVNSLSSISNYLSVYLPSSALSVLPNLFSTFIPIVIILILPVIFAIVSAVLLLAYPKKRGFLITSILSTLSILSYIFLLIFIQVRVASFAEKFNSYTQSLFGGYAGNILSYISFGYYLFIIFMAVALVFSIIGLFKASNEDIGTSGYSRAPAYAAPAGTGSLTGIEGMYKGAVVNLNAGEEVVIGRDSAFSHVVVDQNADLVSRKHCGIIYNPESRLYNVIDYSSNGTYTDGGTRLMANIYTHLPAGTVISLGNSVNSFRLN